MPTRREQDAKIVAALKNLDAEYWYFIHNAGPYYDMVGIVEDDHVYKMPMPLAVEQAFAWERDKAIDENGFQDLCGRPPVVALRTEERIITGSYEEVLGKLLEDCSSAVGAAINCDLEGPEQVTCWMTKEKPAPGRAPYLRTTYTRLRQGVAAMTVDGQEREGHWYSGTFYLLGQDKTTQLDLRDIVLQALRIQ